jgi:glycosyltransferase involved in cell wall biosynthesis
MKRNSEIRKVAFLGDYLPRQCGIATFTHDLTTSVASRYPAADCFVLPVNDVAGGYDYPPEVRFEIEQDERDSYRRAADFLNLGNFDVACLQHEYGIFGGPAGRYILDLLRALRMPVVTTLHTVLSEPNVEQRRVLAELTEISARVVVMTERSRSFLRERSGVPEAKIDLIAHGIPDMPFVDPSFYKDKLGVGGKLVALTFGLLSPNKGIEHMLRAMPEILGDFPTFVYIVLGATHPNLLREQGERYRQSLEAMAQDLGIAKNVIFDNRFVALGELTEFIVAADVYVTPYLNPAQSVSGTLAYSFGCGKAVVSTPYWHAEELLADHRGVLVPFADAKSLAREIRDLLHDEPRRHAMRKTAYLIGRGMVWENVARLYMESFQRARGGRTDTTLSFRDSRTPPEAPAKLPAWRLDHLQRLTDSTGIFQFADHGIPNFAEGYCTDDVARALLLTVLLEELGLDSVAVEGLATTYSSFLQFAFNPERLRFRNFLSFDRRWGEDTGSDDCQGRAVWALGACLGRSKRRRIQFWAAQYFEQAVTAIAAMTAPRAWAFGLLGIREYLHRLEGDRLIGQIQQDLTNRLLDLFDRSATVQWPWCEGVLAYDNARLPQALIATGGDRASATGLRALRWLVSVQKSPRGDFRPIGSNGFYRRGGEKAQFDQQPVEAQATVAACLEAYRATGDKTWLGEAHIAFRWFLGGNDLGLALYDPDTGGCCDGLLQDRVNLNQGAESTLAFLLSLAELSLQERTQAT